MTTPTRSDVLDLLLHGDLELEGRLMEASNTTLRAVITHDGTTARCVYKPIRGERPLRDFPDGTLAGREVAAYAVSEATGWGIVPPTVLRDGPLGPGACQLWIEEDDEEPPAGFVPADAVPADWHPIMSARDPAGKPYVLAHAGDDAVARVAILDTVINNADRKAGHLLRAADGHVYGVDHGICFHAVDKLRSILWGWAGEPLPDSVGEVLTTLVEALDGPLGSTLALYLTPREVAATRRRAQALRESARFPLPPEDRHIVPWPPV